VFEEIRSGKGERGFGTRRDPCFEKGIRSHSSYIQGERRRGGIMGAITKLTDSASVRIKRKVKIYR